VEFRLEFAAICHVAAMQQDGPIQPPSCPVRHVPRPGALTRLVGPRQLSTDRAEAGSNWEFHGLAHQLDFASTQYVVGLAHPNRLARLPVVPLLFGPWAYIRS
jgi:hypothetical protein